MDTNSHESNRPEARVRAAQRPEPAEGAPPPNRDPWAAGPPDAVAAAADATWQPRIVAFFCTWCTYTAADLAGVSRLKYAPNAGVIRMMCSGRVDPQFILAAFASGADGVLLGGCHPGDCHYAEGNFKTMRRVALLQRLLEAMGIERQRLRLEWISASEGERVKTVVNEMVGQLRALGPLRLAGQPAAGP